MSGSDGSFFFSTHPEVGTHVRDLKSIFHEVHLELCTLPSDSVHSFTWPGGVLPAVRWWDGRMFQFRTRSNPVFRGIAVRCP